ncbi:hypothetical protein ColLi_12239 [Colletotrichum liriopes]|uniref:Uncharacterized protein n=1 Tax=Colletotrichum liriopes TaxID=708192 RepID=A0AA37GY14_9PEZI|nr:hypothetical protein ColLi_12239 [Colletotrichum liriopes]
MADSLHGVRGWEASKTAKPSLIASLAARKSQRYVWHVYASHIFGMHLGKPSPELMRDFGY